MTHDDRTQLQENLESTAPHTPLGAADPLVGRTLKNSYRIEGRIGEGGMGVVYRATQISLGRPVAVKTIHPDNKLPPQAIERFFREGRLLSQFHHPNIVHILDFGTDDTLHFLVMEYLEGETLESFVRKRGALSIDLVVDLLEQICAGMEAAHQKGVIHRDLKPANVLVLQVTGSPRPIAKILDFGLGKTSDTSNQAAGLTREGMIMGTLCYSAPEQLGGGAVDARADIYSLGAILYYLLTGRPPYSDEGFRSTLMKQLSQPPEPLRLEEVPTEEGTAIEALVHQAMSPNPEDRPANPTEFFEALSRIARPGDTLSDRSRPSRVDTGRDVWRPRKAAKGSRRAFLLGGAAAGVAVLGGLGGWWKWSKQPRGPGATAPGVTDTEIILGMSGPFSGPTRELGRYMRVGLETCFNHFNDNGGIHGRGIRLVALDDGYEPAQAAENMKKLLDEYGVFAFIGNVGTPTTEQALPIALEKERIFYAAYTGAPLLRKDPPDRHVFNYRASYAEETAAIVRFLTEVKKVPPQAIAVFAQKDGYGAAGFQGVAKALRKQVAAEQILQVGYDRNSADVRQAVETIVAAGNRIQAVVMVATYRPAARFIKLVRDAGLRPTFTNVSFVGSGSLAEELREMGPKYAPGVIVTQVVPHYESRATGVIRYREHQKQYFPSEPPGFLSLEGYIAARILVEGMKNAGPQLTTDSLVDGLERIRDLDLAIGTKINFAPSEHQGSHKVWGTVLDEKGVYRDLELD